MSQDVRSILAVVLRWVARVWGGLAALLLLAFFVAHLQEWFRDPHHLPPLFVFAAQLFHLTFIVGLLMAWRWEVRGALLALGGAVGFFTVTGAPVRMLPFLAVVAAPPLLWLCSAWLSHRIARERAKE
jgi:hypothetical protein